jgi:uncharacterized membrane protein YidH (DUF202 family)
MTTPFDPQVRAETGPQAIPADSERAEESVDIGRIQLLLAEKRTALAALRTGLAIFTLPLSVTTVLVTTSRFYNFMENLHFLIPLLLLCIILVVTGTYLIVVSLLRFRHQSEQIRKIKVKSPKWQELID